MEENVEFEEIKSESTEQKVEQPTISALPYDFILASIQENAKQLGQMAFLEENVIENGVSNTVSVIRILSNNEKQFFRITIEEVKELTLKK